MDSRKMCDAQGGEQHHCTKKVNKKKALVYKQIKKICFQNSAREELVVVAYCVDDTGTGQ